MPTHLDGVLLHGQGTHHIVQLKVKTAGIADGLTARIATPQRCIARLAVGAGHPSTSRGALWNPNEQLVGVKVCLEV